VGAATAVATVGEVKVAAEAVGLVGVMVGVERARGDCTEGVMAVAGETVVVGSSFRFSYTGMAVEREEAAVTEGEATVEEAPGAEVGRGLVGVETVGVERAEAARVRAAVETGADAVEVMVEAARALAG
jgi:hypothetical protein